MLLRRHWRVRVPAFQVIASIGEVLSVYAVVKSGGKQYRVSTGETIDVEKLSAAEGESVTLDKVLLVADGEKVTVGRPTVEGASVSATVVQHGLKRKAVVFHYRPKERYRVKKGHRQHYTRLRIEQIKS
jgi:large subunit ribosomal protein L21